MFNLCLDIGKECMGDEHTEFMSQASNPRMLDVIRNTQNMHIIEHVIDYLSVCIVKVYNE